jgi:O-antigen/teichoic acid export membrane protein
MIQPTLSINHTKLKERVLDMELNKVARKSEESVTIKKISLGAFITFFGRVLNSLFTYLTLIMIAKLLGPYYFGIYSYIYSMFMFLTNISTLGLDKGILRFVPIWRKKEIISEGLSGVLQLLVLFSLIIVFLLNILSPIISKLYTSSFVSGMIFFMSLGLIFQSIIIFSRATLQALFYYDRAVLTEDYIRPLLFFTLLLILFFLNFNTNKLPLFVMVVFAVAYFLSAMFSLFILNRALKLEKLQLKFKPFIINKVERNIIYFSVINMFTTIMSQSRINILIMITGLFVKPEMIGYINIAARSVFFIGFVLVAVNSVFGPLISSFYENGNLKKLQELYVMTVKWITIFGSIICILFVINSNLILSFFGKEYIIASNELKILSIGELSSIWVGSVSYILMMTGKQKQYFITMFLTLMLSIMFTIILVPYIGILGTSISLFFGSLFSNVINLLLVKKYLYIFPYNKYNLRILLILLLTLSNGILIYHYMRVTIITAIIYSLMLVFMYFLFIYLWCLDKKEKDNLHNFILKNIVYKILKKDI